MRLQQLDQLYIYQFYVAVSGCGDTHRPCRQQPWMFLGQMGHLGHGTDDALIDHVGNNLGKSQVVPGKMGHLGPGTDDALMSGTTLDVLGCPRTDGTSQTWD